MDEFQQIAEYPDKNVLELLRTYVQKCKHTWFIFAGSDRRMMEKLFNNLSEPFYMSCSPLYLDAIQYENYLAFARQHFEAAGKSLQEESFKQVYELFDGHTWYVQRLMNEIAIAKDGQAQQVTSVAFCKKHSMKSPSTVQSALRVLHDKGIVRKDGNSYSVTNRLLGIWLAKEY